MALSATIREPESFHNWLQTSETFKYEQDIKNGFYRKPDSSVVHLVVHSERHTDLVTYTYGRHGLQHYHPFFDLTEDVLNLHTSVPSTTRLSPAETLQLYDAICDYLPQEMKLDAYFICHCKNGFLTRNSVRQYEIELAKVFYNLSQTDTEAYNVVRNRLKPDQIIKRNEENHLFCIQHIKSLLNDLNKRNMLPVIIFSYNRSMIHTMTEIMIKHFQNQIVSSYYLNIGIIAIVCRLPSV